MPNKATAQLITEIWERFTCLIGNDDMQLNLKLDGSGSVSTVMRSNTIILCCWDELEDAIGAMDAME